MPWRKRRPSLLGGLLWTGLGLVLLLRNFGIGPDFWSMAGRYWPILLILLGLGKVIDYFRQKEGVSLRLGEVFGVLLLLLLGTVLTKLSRGPMRGIFRDGPVLNLGGVRVEPGQWIGTSYTFTQETTYPVATPMPLRVENSYGLVSVTPGSDREIKVRLRKVVYTDEEARAKQISDEIRLEGGPEGKAEAGTFVVKTNRDSLVSKGYRFNTEMEVLIPQKSQLQIRNSFGEVRVSNLAGKLDINTSHKSLEVRDCTGEVVVSNRYNESRLFNVTGNITVDARGGRVYLETIKGDVNVRNEYSPVDINDVDGKVTVSNSDSSIRLEKITKPVIVDGRGSQVKVHNLSDTLKLTASHQRVQISEVSANVSLDSRYSSLSVKDVKGNVEILSSSDRITLEGIGGSLKIQGQGSSVRAHEVNGPVDIATTLKDVIVNDLAAGCKIINEYGNVTVSVRTLGKEDLTVKNKNGNIELFLPEDAAFQIDAVARNGRADSDFSGLEPAERTAEGGILKGKVKTGEPQILLETEYSNIYVRMQGRDADRERESDKKRKKSPSRRNTS